jgi:type III pantothenate kinase
MSSFVAIDIGNTRITIGWWEQGGWMHEWHLSSKARRTDDEWTILLDATLRRADYRNKQIEQIAISSVVPGLTECMAKSSREIGFDPQVIGVNHIKSVRIAYDPPNAVGPDRLCGVAAAIHKYGAPVVIVDLGTATVIDVVDNERVYRGGIIAPGVATASESLHQNAALLPKVDLAFPEKVIGANTVHAIQSGILYGSLAMIDGLISRIHSEVGDATVVATGGFAALLEGRSTTIAHVERQLVLDGVRILARGEWS